MTIINRIRAFFASDAQTIGLSPKVLGPVIAGLIATLVKQVGLEPQDIATFINDIGLPGLTGLTAGTILGAEVVVGATIATWLLTPGRIVAKVGTLTSPEGSDGRLSDEAQAGIAAAQTD